MRSETFDCVLSQKKGVKPIKTTTDPPHRSPPINTPPINTPPISQTTTDPPPIETTTVGRKERTFIVLDNFIKGDLSHGEPHVEGLFPELLPLRNWCIKKTT
ncbi:hypothetical protein IGI04_013766 [Brassica rapa subsp. trilocularis]|uniref:Uncharacterized protein n=1 Tax=Brassica rapa subsp. trilocularis TaxID=1813537 RepID=A0ABQ7N9S5_BRACM|nr:hypothetical protein IGI04_013766 [Brassica rapa subsp. trilocularis]